MDRFGGYNSQQFNGTGSDRSKDFRKIAQTIGSDIEKISSNVSSMKKLVTSPQDSQDLKTQLHNLQHYTHSLVKDTKVNLKELNSIPAPALVTDQREFKITKERLQEEFTYAANAFQEIQRYELQKEKEEVRRTRANSNIAPPPTSKDIFGDDSFSSNQLIELRDSNMSQQQLQSQLQDELDLQMIQEQERSIQELEKNIGEVNDIFKELAAMVHDQGEIVDSIEASVEKTEVFVDRGNTELRKAAHYTTQMRKKRCILLLCGSGILVVLLLIIYFSNNN